METRRPPLPAPAAAPPCPIIRRAPARRLFLSGPVSRILSGATIHLSGFPEGLQPCGLPGPRRAGSSVLLGLAPGGVCLAAASPRRRCALTAPFHLCLCAAHVRPRHRPCVSVALSRGFPRVGATHRPCPVVSGLSSRGFLSPRDRSARRSMVVPNLWRAKKRCAGHSRVLREIRAAAVAATDRAHAATADGAFGRAAGQQVLPGAEDHVLERQTRWLEQPQRRTLRPRLLLNELVRRACGGRAHSLRLS
jgi:hypothetical protein